ncbi:hypothetical protein OG851_39270 [Streptomyces sp. NBC_00161]|uniref:BTAD domain-containing putative transcriptional regulator n=1 Tax=Streptomyces sp. NBC_00161 TaxID=2975671 RepID=UPI0032535ED8
MANIAGSTRSYEQAERTLRHLSLWRGRAPEDLPGRVFDRGVRESVATAGRELGRTGDLVPELRAVQASAPLRKSARTRLMLAPRALALVVEAVHPLAPMPDEEAVELFRACAAGGDPSRPHPCRPRRPV